MMNLIKSLFKELLNILIRIAIIVLITLLVAFVLSSFVSIRLEQLLLILGILFILIGVGSASTSGTQPMAKRRMHYDFIDISQKFKDISQRYTDMSLKNFKFEIYMIVSGFILLMISTFM